ncbi:MAG: hypothetical protein H6667_13480 [Ardenticatenaceae bacterium]|nr:hypothetical protein [Ardenticatenaceae bacterium]MCB9442757.1 hypothetical protein [Ardenticatenaceae bacterium]
MRTKGLIGGTILLVLLFIVVGTAVVLGWSIGIGWLLTRFLPFAWFEASLLVMLASMAIGALGVRMLLSVPPPASDFGQNELFEPAISSERFYPSDGEVTSEAWFRFEMANDIYWDLTDTPSVEHSMAETELKELAIRLADVVVDLLKSRTSRSSRINVTKNQLVRQMEKMNLRPYDDDILQVAAGSASLRLSWDEAMADIVHEKSWDKIEPDF